MNSRPNCCVPCCSNTWELTKDKMTYFRFPTNENMKKKWLDAIKWNDGKPGYNHYVCADHFNVEELSAIDDNTNIVPTIFNPEFVAIKTESKLFNAIPISLSNAELDVEMIKTEFDDDGSVELGRYEILEAATLSDNEIEIPKSNECIKTEMSHSDIELECYQIIDTPEVSDNETVIPVPKKMKIENSSLNEKPTNEGSTKQSVGDEGTNTIKLDLSKLRLQIANSLSSNPASPTRTQHLIRPNACTSKTTYREWEDHETQDFVNCLLKHKNEFRKRDVRKITKSLLFWTQMAGRLKKRGIIKQPITATHLLNKWNSLLKSYDRLPVKLNNHNSTIFPFMREMKKILTIKIGSTSLSQTTKTATPTNDSTDRGASIKTNGIKCGGSTSISANETNIEISQDINPRNIRWLDKDMRTFFQCLLNHKDEFLKMRKRKKYVFWEKIISYLRQHGDMTQIPTREQIHNKWKQLMNTYQQVTSDLGNNSGFPFMDEMKEILIDSLNSDLYAISIGLKSSCQSVNDESINHFSSMIDDDANTKNTVVDGKTTDISSDNLNNKTERNITKNTSNDALKAEMAELKQKYLKKKIEGRELKNKLLRRLLNDPKCNIITNGFKLIKADQS